MILYYIYIYNSVWIERVFFEILVHCLLVWMGEIMRNRKSAFPFAVTIEMLSAVVRSPSSSSICMRVWTIWLQVLEQLENVKAAPIAHTMMCDLVPISTTAHALAIAYMSTQQSHETASAYINTIQLLIKCRLKSKSSFRRTKYRPACFYGWVRSSHIPARHGWSHTSCDCWRVCTEFKERIDKFATESKTKKRWWKEKKGINLLRIRFCSVLCSSSILYTVFDIFTSFCTPSLFILRQIYPRQITKSCFYKLPSIYI